MSTKAKIKATFMGHRFHEPPEEYSYDDDKYSVLSRNALEIEASVKKKSDMMVSYQDLNLIREWMDKFNLNGDIREWEQITLPLIQFFKIPTKDRLTLYSTFRETTIAKLKKALKVLDKCYKVVENKTDPDTNYLYLLIKKRRDHYYNKLHSFPTTGKYVFQYYHLKKLFYILACVGNEPKRQINIVIDLLRRINKSEFKKDSIRDLRTISKLQKQFFPTQKK
jgi:hypothetical protein